MPVAWYYQKSLNCEVVACHKIHMSVVILFYYLIIEGDYLVVTSSLNKYQFNRCFIYNRSRGAFKADEGLIRGIVGPGPYRELRRWNSLKMVVVGCRGTIAGLVEEYGETFKNACELQEMQQSAIYVLGDMFFEAYSEMRPENWKRVDKNLIAGAVRAFPW